MRGVTIINQESKLSRLKLEPMAAKGRDSSSGTTQNKPVIVKSISLTFQERESVFSDLDSRNSFSFLSRFSKRNFLRMALSVQLN